MNKTTLAVIILVAAIGIAAFFIFSGGNFSLPAVSQKQAQPDQAAGGQDQPQSESVPELAGPLLAALEQGGSAKCSFTDANNIEGTALIKDGQIRVEAKTPQGQQASLIFKGGQTWVWQPETSQGITFIASKLDPRLAAQVPDRGLLIRELAKNQQSCQEQEVETSQFEPPTQVDFQDLSKIQLGQ